MASIKVDCTRVIRACNSYDIRYRQWKQEHKEDKSDDGAWIETKCKSNDANTVQWIRGMADAVKDSQYPYVNLSYKDYQLLGRYLV